MASLERDGRAVVVVVVVVVTAASVVGFVYTCEQFSIQVFVFVQWVHCECEHCVFTLVHETVSYQLCKTTLLV